MTEFMEQWIQSRIDVLMDMAGERKPDDEMLDRAADVLGDWIADNAHKEDNSQAIFRLGEPWL